MVVVLSRPPVAPPGAATSWVGVSIKWTGADGSVWDLTSGAGGAWVEPGIEGLHNPVIVKHRSVSRAFAGHRPRGSRVATRELFMTVLVYGDGSTAWQDAYTRFSRSVHPDVHGVLEVSYNGSRRRLRCTGLFDEGHEFGVDPHVMGWERFGLALEADQPLWEAETPILRGPWSEPAPQDFFNDGEAPPFFISASSAFGSSVMDNPGDVDAFPVWRVTGALSALELGVGGRVIEVPFDVEDGSVLVIDTDPRHLTATLDGVDVTGLLGFQRFAPVPPRGSVPVHVAGSGAGSVSCELTPLFFRAF